jgi:hypothetical protein
MDARSLPFPIPPALLRLACAATLASALAGCGGGDAGPDGSPADGPAPAADAQGCSAEATLAALPSEIAVSCHNGVTQYAPKGQALPEVTAEGPWLRVAKATADGDDSRAVPLFGGNGGALSTVFCPTILGGTGRSGALLDAISFTCVVGGSVVSVGPFGGGGGGPFNANCPAGFIGVGIQGGSGTLIDRVGFVCRNSAGQRFTTSVFGGGGGSPFYFECASNAKLVGFRVRSGALVDNLQPLCGPR